MCHSCSARRAGLTLLELVVVLGILAIMSSLAVRSLEPIADQARYEATQRLLDDLRSAAGGESRSTGRAAIGGYIADTGLLPGSTTELLARPGALIDHALQTFDSDRDTIVDVSLSSGWRGPYMQLGVGLSDIRDGWGRSVTIVPSGGGAEFVSMGADGDSIAPEDGYRADIVVPVLPRDFSGDVVCRLFAIDALSGLRIDPSPTGTEQLGVLLYGVNADGGSDGSIEEQMLVVPGSGSFDVRRSNTTQGMIALRGLLWDDLDGDDELDIGESILKKSYVHTVLVQPAVDTRVEMELR